MPANLPLTRLQRAYVVGRHPDYPWGGLAAHDHRVYRGPLDVERFRAAWRAALARHDMLRAVIDPDRAALDILPTAPHDGLVVHDLREAGPEAAAQVADRLSHELRPLDRWPLVGVEICLMPDEDRHELHVSFDATVIDLASWWTVLDEVTADYLHPGSAPEPPAVTWQEHETLRAARERCPAPPSLPPGPPVPANYTAPPRIEISHSVLDPEDWQTLRAAFRARKVGETPAVLAVLAQIVAAWRECTSFTASVPRAHRVPYHPDVARLVGPLSTISLVGFDVRGSESITELAAATQRTMWAELSTPEADGMVALEAFSKRHRAQVAAPFVFTSLLGAGDPARPVLGGMVADAVHTQNAQVALDVRFDQPAGALHLAWHERAEVFEPDEVAGVAAVTERVLLGLASGELDLDGPAVEVRAVVARLLAEISELTMMMGDM